MQLQPLHIGQFKFAANKACHSLYMIIINKTHFESTKTTTTNNTQSIAL